MVEISWRGWVHSGAQRAHARWLERGRKGEGRLVVVGKDLRGIGPLHELRFARFVRCEMSEAKLTRAMCDGIELAGCTLSGSVFAEADFPEARIEDCRADGCDFRLARFTGARLLLCDLRGVDGEHSRWEGATLVGVDFRDARLRNPVLDDAEIRRCDFRNTELRRGDPTFERLGTAYQTVFTRCDFRGADLSGLRLRDTMFVDCALHGLRGAPALEGACEIVGADLSEGWDGSDVRDDGSVVDGWREG